MYLTLKGRERNVWCRENEIRQNVAKIQAWPDISPIHTCVNIPAIQLKNTLLFLIRAGIFTKM